MNKIWYGAKDNEVAFATSENALTNHGINNPRSFTTSGDVSGLNLIDQEQAVGASSQQTPTQA